MTVVVSGVTHRYGARTALDEVDLRCEPGRPHGLLGHNGAGKSTLVKLVLGLLAPTQGTVQVPAGLTVGYLPEERGGYRAAPVEAQLRFFAAVAGARDARGAADRWIDRLGLGSLRGRRLRHLSKGNAQKVQLAMALGGSPDLLVLDEPFTGLDPYNRDLFVEVVTDYARDHHVLLSAHELGATEDVCADVTVLDAGKVVASGTVDDVRRSAGARSARLRLSGPPPDSLLGSRHWRTTVADGQVTVEGVNTCADLTRLLTHCAADALIDELVVRTPTLAEAVRELTEEGTR
jgi:ABC-2 type transport system ATP-binding protein